MTGSPFDVLRSKREFIPGGFRDEDGVWHDGPHQAEFDEALDAIANVLERIALGSHGRLESGLLDNERGLLRHQPKPDWMLAKEALT